MFKIENNVPDVYIQQSRDFQLVSRLYDLVVQSSRFEIDSMQRISDTTKCNNTVLPLIATKVGFFTNYDISEDTYRKVLSAFPYIIHYKGSLEGIVLIKNLFERISNTKIEINTEKLYSDHAITFEFDTYGVDYELFSALLEYVRPTGLLFNYKLLTDTTTVSDYVTSDSVVIVNMPVTNIDDTELSGAVAKESTSSVTTNYKEYSSAVDYTQIALNPKEDEENNK